MNFPNSSLSSKSQSFVSSADSVFNPLVASNNTLSTTLFSRHASLLFIDSTVEDYQSLVAGAAPGTEVHILNGVQDAVTQITNTLMGREGIDSIHIVSHGESGSLDFANSLLNLSDLPKYVEQIQSWGKSLTDDADILLYGCNVAEGELGQAFVQILSQLTGADIAASSNLTGNSELGGDWDLEVTTGKIDSSAALQKGAMEAYASVLAPVLSASGTTNYQTSSSPVVLASNLTVNDSQGATLDGARVSVTTNFNSSQDLLGIQGQSGTSGTVSGLSWSYSTSTGVLTLTGTASVNTYQTALRQVTYSNSSGSPSPNSRAVRFSLGNTLANPDNGHFYEFVSSNNISWTSGRNGAASRSLFGLQGYLATITSTSEQSFIESKVQGNGWIGASDAASEGTWKWVTGPENGVTFWSGLANGSPVNGAYSNWAPGEPNNDSNGGAGDEDYGHVIGNPSIGNLNRWNDRPDAGAQNAYSALGYLVEYGGMQGDPAVQITGDVSVNITPANAVPSVSLPGGAISYTENATATVLDTSATVSDSDSTNFDTGTLTVSFSANGTTDDRLIINNQGTGAGQIGISGNAVTYGGTTIGTFTGGTGTTSLVITFNANSSPVAAQALLRNIGYSNVSDTPSTTARTVSVVLTDGDGGTSSTATKTVNVTAVDDPSTLTISGNLNYTEGDAAVIVAPSLTITDVDGMNGARVSIASPSTGDRLGIQGQSGTSGTISGLSWSYSTSTGILTFSGAGSAATYESVLRQVTYVNTGDAPTPGNLNIQFSLGSVLSNPDNDHFYEFVTASGITWTAAQTAAANRSLFGLQGYLVTVTSAAEQAFVQSKLQGLGWLGASDAAVEGDWRWVTGPEGLANGGAGTQFWSGNGSGGPVGGQYSNWQTIEPNDASGEDYAHFLNGGKWNDYANTTFVQGYVVEYGGMPGDPALQTTGDVTVSITAVNDAPVNNVPAAQTINEDTQLIFSSGNSNAISITDPDAGNGSIQVTLAATNGVLLTSNGGGATITGNNSSSVTITGVLADVNSALNGLSFTPTAEYSGSASIQITTSDQGNTGGSALTDTDTINITINSVNDAPSFTPGTNQTILAGAGAQTVTGWATGFNPGASNESGQTLQAYQIVSNSDPSIFSVAPAIDASGNLTYTPVSSIASATTATIGVKVQDSGGTANGGVDTSATQFFTITVKTLPTASISSVSQNEGNSGTTAFTFTVSLSNAGDTPLTVNYATQDGTATVADNDYTGATGTLTFAPGETSKQITVNVNGETKYEQDQSFSVVLSNVTNGFLSSSNGTGTGTITNDDSVPTVNITSAVSVAEGNTGTAPVNFTVTLTNPSEEAIAINYTTVDGTATTAANDYTAASGIVSFAPGETSKTISVNVKGDAAFEANETFQVNLTGPAQGSGSVAPGTTSGTGTITNDDAPPSFRINSVSHSEGTRGNKTYTFTVTLTGQIDQPVSVNYTTTDGTATIADSDYAAASGVLNFAVGETSKTITVTATGDKKLEGTEQFTVNLSGATGGTVIANGIGTGIIGDDDGNGSDFNLDGKVDFFWRNASTSENQFWIMNNTNFSAVAILPIAEPEWKVEGFADFNDDGIDDVLWHNMKDARVVVWTLNASGFAGFTNLGLVSPNLRVADLGDYDGDNKIDIFWRNASTAENVIWKMNGTSFVSFTNLAQADSTWSVVDAGDFDGDGDLDIFWRNINGSNSIWQLNNASFGTFTNLAVVHPNYVVGDIADFDNDGKLDILWHGNNNGGNVIWKMNGVALQSVADLTHSMGYKAENVVDLDRDGKLEIIWRYYGSGNSSSGKNVAWHINGTALSGSDDLLSAVPNWVPYFP